MLARYHYNVANTRVDQHVEKGNDDGLYISSVACCQVGRAGGREGCRRKEPNVGRSSSWQVLLCVCRRKMAAVQHMSVHAASQSLQQQCGVGVPHRLVLSLDCLCSVCGCCVCLMCAGAVGAHHGRWHRLHSADIQPQQPVPAQGVDHGEQHSPFGRTPLHASATSYRHIHAQQWCSR